MSTATTSTTQFSTSGNGRVYDFAGIGVGPFNLGLAALSEPVKDLDGVFLERRESFDWHPGMMLEPAHLQVPFMADLVTLADPTSPYSFLNFLKQTGRLYRFYIRENFYPLRAEYNQYCQWVAGQLPSVRFGTDVTDVAYDDGVYTLSVEGPAGPEVLRARRLVLGTGTLPYVPEACRGILDAGGTVLHNAEYLARKSELQQQRSITIVGSGQSAAEIYYELLQDIDAYGYQLNWVTRSGRFFPLEYTKLTLEMTSPEYVDYFHGLPQELRDSLIRSQKNLYKGINSDLVDAIYDLLYTKSLAGMVDTRLLTLSTVTGAAWNGSTGTHTLELRHGEQGTDYSLETEAVVLATGYAYREPGFLAGVQERIARDSAGRFAVQRNYSTGVEPGEIFVQNAELHTHGFVTPDLGMAAYRNSCILRDILGREVYPVERNIAFQEFGAPAAAAEVAAHIAAPVGLAAAGTSKAGVPARFTFRCLDPQEDAPLLHSWVTQPYASFWGMLNASVDDVVEEYAKIQSSGHHHALLGIGDDGVPAFLMEEYLPASSPLNGVYAVQTGDIGMHLLVAPPQGAPRSGFTAGVMESVLDRIFQKPGVDRVVVEPDARNTKIHVLNARLGFEPAGEVDLPDKQALLSFCTREAFESARAARSLTPKHQSIQEAAL